MALLYHCAALELLEDDHVTQHDHVSIHGEHIILCINGSTSEHLYKGVDGH